MYPAIEPYHRAYVRVSSVHTVYYEESGNPNGVAVLFVHGGPGAGTMPMHRCFFNPDHYRIVLVDQRGAGKSQPFCALQENNTQSLVEDLEIVRQTLAIEQWVLFGGSWGSTLSLVYAITHPDRVKALVLRGVFLAQASEWQWLLFSTGAARFFPKARERLLSDLALSDDALTMDVLYDRLSCPNQSSAVARAWARWELSLLALHPNNEEVEARMEHPQIEALGALQIHYAKHDFFLSPDFIMKNIGCLGTIPITIMHGQYDMVCPVQSAWRLHDAVPHATMHILHAGHAGTEKVLSQCAVEVMDAMI